MIEVQKTGFLYYKAYVDGEYAGNLSLDDDAHHAVVVMVEPAFRRKGVATALYKYAEKDIGHKLAPSPHYQSESAKAFWKTKNPEEWQRNCISIVYIPYDYNKGGYKKPSLQNMRKGKVVQDSKLLANTRINRIEIASKFPRGNRLPVAIYRYSDILEQKGKAEPLYLVERSDWEDYMQYSDEQDNRN